MYAACCVYAAVSFRVGAWRSLVARTVRVGEVASSNLAAPTLKLKTKYTETNKPFDMTKTIKILSPIDDSVVGEVPAADKAAVDVVFKKLRLAQSAWAAKPLKDRAAVVKLLAETMTKHQDELADLLVREVGKTPDDAKAEVERTVELTAFAITEAEHIKPEEFRSKDFPGWRTEKKQTVSRVPLGVVVAIAPFNYPVNLSISKVAPALLMGNTVLLKPPTQGSVVASRLVALAHEAGVPEDVLQVVTGAGNEIGDHLVTHPDCKLVAMTGSVKAGKHIASKAGMIPLLLELGGNDPAIVLEDADLDVAAEAITKGAFKYAGQRCTAVKRVYVADKIADNLIDRLVRARNEHFGSAGDPREHPVGPVISDEQAEYAESLIKDATEQGATVLCGGGRRGQVVEATIIDHAAQTMRVVAEEQFAPVLPIIRVQDADEAVRLSNDTPYGLQASIFTKDTKQGEAMAAEIEAGGVHINGPDERGPDNFLFVGHKDSGLGSQGVRFSLEAMSKHKGVVHNRKG